MPGPSKHNRRLKAKNDRRKKQRAAGGRTPSEAALGRSMAAAGLPVSKSNQRVGKGYRGKGYDQPSGSIIEPPKAKPKTSSAVEKMAKIKPRSYGAAGSTGSVPVVRTYSTGMGTWGTSFAGAGMAPSQKFANAKSEKQKIKKRTRGVQARIDRRNKKIQSLKARPTPRLDIPGYKPSGKSFKYLTPMEQRAPGKKNRQRQRKAQNTQRQLNRQKKLLQKDRRTSKDITIVSQTYRKPDYKGPRTLKEQQRWHDDAINRMTGDSKVGKRLREAGLLPKYNAPNPEQGGRTAGEISKALEMLAYGQNLQGTKKTRISSAAGNISKTNLTAAKGAWKGKEPKVKDVVTMANIVPPPAPPPSKKQLLKNPRARRQYVIEVSRQSYVEAAKQGLPVARPDKNPWAISDASAPENETPEQQFRRESKVLAKLQRENAGTPVEQIDATVQQAFEDRIGGSATQILGDPAAIRRIGEDFANRARYVLPDDDTLVGRTLETVPGLSSLLAKGDPAIDGSDSPIEYFDRLFSTKARYRDGREVANRASFADWLSAAATVSMARLGVKAAIGGSRLVINSYLGRGTKFADQPIGFTGSLIAQSRGTKAGEFAAKVLNKLPTQQWRRVRHGAGIATLGASGVDLTLAGINEALEAAGKDPAIPALPWNDDEAYESYVFPVIQNYLTANVADSLGATARNLVTAIVYPFTVGANVALTARRGIRAIGENVDGPGDPYYGSMDYVLQPVATLAKETIDEIVFMAETFTSRDVNRIRQVTEQDLGYIPLMAGYWLTRTTLGDSVSFAAKKIAHSAAGRAAAAELARNRFTSPTVRRIDAMKRSVDAWKEKGRAVMVAGRAVGEADWLSSTLRNAIARPLQIYRAIPGTKKATAVLGEISDRYAAQHYSDPESRGSPRKVEVEDLVALFATMGFNPAKGKISQLRERRDSSQVTPGGTEHRLLVHAIEARHLWEPDDSARSRVFQDMFNSAVDADDVVTRIRDNWALENGEAGRRQMLRDRAVTANETLAMADSMNVGEGAQQIDDAVNEKFKDAPEREAEATERINSIRATVNKLLGRKKQSQEAVEQIVEEQRTAIDEELKDRVNSPLVDLDDGPEFTLAERRKAAVKAGQRRSRGQRRETMGQRRRERRKRQARQRRYDATPEGVNEQQWYHGSADEDLTAGNFDVGVSAVMNWFGQGLYLTNVPQIGRIFRRGRATSAGTRGRLYQAKVNVKKVLDSRAPITPDVEQMVEELANEVDAEMSAIGGNKVSFFGDQVRDALDIPFDGTAGGAIERLLGTIDQPDVVDFVQNAPDSVEAQVAILNKLGELRQRLVDLGYDALSYKLNRNRANNPKNTVGKNQALVVLRTEVLLPEGRGALRVVERLGDREGVRTSGPQEARFDGVPERARTIPRDVPTLKEVEARIATLDTMIERGEGDAETLQAMRKEARDLRAKLKRAKSRIKKVAKRFEEKRARQQAALDAIEDDMRREKVSLNRQERIRTSARRQMKDEFTKQEREDLFLTLDPVVQRAAQVGGDLDQKIATLNLHQEFERLENQANENTVDLVIGGPKAVQKALDDLEQIEEAFSELKKVYDSLPEGPAKQAYAVAVDQWAQTANLLRQSVDMARQLLESGKSKKKILKALADERYTINSQMSMVEDMIRNLEVQRKANERLLDIDQLARNVEAAEIEGFYEQEKDIAIEEIVEQLEERAAEAKEILALEDPVHLRHREEVRGKMPPAAGTDQNPVAMPEDGRRSGELQGAGQVDRGYEALTEGQQREVDRNTNRHIIRAFAKEGIAAVEWPDGSIRTVVSKEEIPLFVRLYNEQHGGDGGSELVIVRRDWFDDPDDVGELIRPTGKKEIKDPQGYVDDLEKGHKFPRSDLEPHAIVDEAFDTRQSEIERRAYGEEPGYVFAKATWLTTFQKLHRDVEGVEKFFFFFNRVSSRLVLGSSIAWMFAQPVAEMAVAMAQHPSQVWRRMPEVKQMRAGGGEGAQLLTKYAQGTPGADPASSYRTRPNYREEQRRVKETVGTVKRSPGYSMIESLLEAPKRRAKSWWRQAGERSESSLDRSVYSQTVADLVTLRLPGNIDRWKAGWIREAAFLANLDHHLKPLTRAAKSVKGQIDIIEKYADMLSKMTREEQLKWIDSDEGMEVGMALAKEIDDQLGNWQDLRPGLEAAIGQVIFFYPFIRFSLNWALRTYPKEHPVVWTLATVMGAANSAMLEELVDYDPMWPTDWAVAPLFGGPNGEITSLMAVNRYNSASNATTELALNDSADPLWNATKIFLPPVTMFAQAVGGLDEFGNKYGENNDDFGQEEPGTWMRAGQALQQMFALFAPYRIGSSITGFNFRNVGELAGARFNKDYREVDLTNFVDPVGNDNNVATAAARSWIVPSIPIPINTITDEKFYRDLEQKARNVQGSTSEYFYVPKKKGVKWELASVKYPGSVAYKKMEEGNLTEDEYRENRGQERVKLRVNGKWREFSFQAAGEFLTGEVRKERSEQPGIGMSPRNPYEQDIAKQYIAIKGRNQGIDDQLRPVYEKMRAFRYKRGFPVDPDSPEGRDKQLYMDEYLSLYRKWKDKNPGIPFPKSRSQAERLLNEDVQPGIGGRSGPVPTEYRDVPVELANSLSDVEMLQAGTKNRLSKMGLRRFDLDRLGLQNLPKDTQNVLFSPKAKPPSADIFDGFDGLMDPGTKLGLAKDGVVLVKKWRGVNVLGEIRLDGIIQMEYDAISRPTKEAYRPYRYHRELDLLMLPHVYDQQKNAENAGDKLSKVNKRIERLVSKAGGVPSGVPAEYRDAIKKWGAWLDKRPDMKSPNDDMVDGLIPKSMTGAEYLAKIMQHESGWNADAYHDRAGATGMGQFIPGTRQGMIDQYGVDPWASGNDAIHAAALYLSEGGGGLVNYNSGYPTSGDNQGTYGTWDGYLGEDVGQMIQVDKKAQARLNELRQEQGNLETVLGKQNKQLRAAGLKPVDVDGVRVGYGLSGQPKPLPGKFSGARRAVSMVLGQPVWGDHMPFPGGTGGPDETEESHSTGGFHDLPNAYAQDIGTAGGRPEEGEQGLGYDQATMDKIARGLQKMGADIDGLTLGEDYRATLPNGYEVELLTSVASGHGDHIHLGMSWVGAGAATGGSVSGGGAGYASSGGGGGAGPSMLGMGGVLGSGGGAGSSWRDMPFGEVLSGGGQDYDEAGVDSAVTTMAETADPTDEGAAVKSGVEQMAALPQVRKKKKVPRFSNNPI